jgi:signal transduction histidine kinase
VKAIRELNQEGVGLGLNIAKRLAEALSFTLSVDSKPGEGTIFTLS